MRRRAEKALLQILAESVVDGERDDERSYACGNSNDGDAGDDPDERLPPFGAQVARSDEEFESHEKQASDLGLQASADSDHRQYSGDLALVGCELFSEPLLQLRIFHPNHHRARHRRERGKGPTHNQPCSDAPGQHLAQMPQIHRMPHVRPNSRRDQPIIVMIRANLGQPSELLPAEVRPGAQINKDAGGEQQQGGDPGPRR